MTKHERKAQRLAMRDMEDKRRRKERKADLPWWIPDSMTYDAKLKDNSEQKTLDRDVQRYKRHDRY